MEILSILITLLMGVCLVAIHYSKLSDRIFYSLLTVLFLFVTICFTSIVPVRYLLLLAGIISLVGLIGVPLQNMLIRNIGIIGYAIIGPIAFLQTGNLLCKTTYEATNHHT